MASIVQKLKQKGILLSDGAWGTQLHEMGLEPGECPEDLNISRPDDVQKIAQSYLDAGSDLIGTNSFGGSSIKLEFFGLSQKAFEINAEAAKISRRAAGLERFVIGSIGPTGKMLIMGDITADELYSAFAAQAKALEAGGADAICIETMSAIDEAGIAVKAAKENTSLEVICTFAFDKTIMGEYRTMMGVSPTEMTIAMLEAGADIIGANCGTGMDDMIEIVKEIRRANSSVPILVHANAGMPQLIDDKCVFPESPDDMARKLPLLINAGANIVGGCCGTTPEHIKKMAEVLSRL